MALQNIKLDIDYVRSQFPAFDDPLSKDWSFFENAGGSYVPKNVIDKLTEFMTSTKVQPYAEYPMSKIAGIDLFPFEIGALSGQYAVVLFGLACFLYLVVSRISRYTKIVRDRMIAVIIFSFL